MSPIGSMVAWLKNLTGTPALPDGWVECNGQTLSDAGSLYNGKVIPNLNGQNRFLRGSSISGGTGGAATQKTQLSGGGNITGKAYDSPIVPDARGGWFETLWTTKAGAETLSPLLRRNTETFSILPPYYNVVWIMRVK